MESPFITSWALVSVLPPLPALVTTCYFFWDGFGNDPWACIWFYSKVLLIKVYWSCWRSDSRILLGLGNRRWLEWRSHTCWASRETSGLHSGSDCRWLDILGLFLTLIVLNFRSHLLFFFLGLLKSGWGWHSLGCVLLLVWTGWSALIEGALRTLCWGNWRRSDLGLLDWRRSDHLFLLGLLLLLIHLHRGHSLLFFLLLDLLWRVEYSGSVVSKSLIIHSLGELVVCLVRRV